MAKQELKITDKIRYQKYSTVGKTYFDGMMYAALELIPKMPDGMWHDFAMKFSEGFAFEATDTFLSVVDQRIEEKMGELKVEIDTAISSIKSSLASMSTAGAGTTPTV